VVLDKQEDQDYVENQDQLADLDHLVTEEVQVHQDPMVALDQEVQQDYVGDPVKPAQKDLPDHPVHQDLQEVEVL